MDPLDPDRIATIKYIYDLTKRTISVGDTVRLGIEGDPCCRYRSADDNAAQTGTVTEIVRDQTGEPVEIVAKTDGSVQKLDFMNVSPDAVWEVVETGQEETAVEALPRADAPYAPDAAPPRADGIDAAVPTDFVMVAGDIGGAPTPQTAPVALDDSTEDVRTRVDSFENSVKMELQTLADEVARARKENDFLATKLAAIEMNSMNSDAFMKQMSAFQESITASQTALARDIVCLHRRETPTNAYLITNYVDNDDAIDRFGSTKHEPELAVGRETVQDIRRWGEDDSTRRFGAGVEYSADDTSEADPENP